MKKKNPLKEKKTNRKRCDWETNHTLICNAFLEILKDTGRKPKVVEIAKKTGLFQKTVQNHIAQIDFSKLKEVYKAGTSVVFNNILKQAATSEDPRWAKVFFEVFYPEEMNKGNKPIEITTTGTTVIKVVRE